MSERIRLLGALRKSFSVGKRSVYFFDEFPVKLHFA
jgi:hypothetical protein